jgi:hypothetical protein
MSAALFEVGVGLGVAGVGADHLGWHAEAPAGLLQAEPLRFQELGLFGVTIGGSYGGTTPTMRTARSSHVGHRAEQQRCLAS